MANEITHTQQTIQSTGDSGAVVMHPQVIQINTLEAVVGVAVVLVGLGVAWGTLKTAVKNIGTTLKDEIAPDLKDVRERFMVVEDRVETLWKDKVAPAHSPRQLNDRGNTILNESGVKEIIEKEKAQLIDVVRTKDISNPYDAEKSILDTVNELPKHSPGVVSDLKNGAFKVGADLDTVLFVGGLHLRNLIFQELGFSLEELDKPRQ